MLKNILNFIDGLDEYQIVEKSYHKKVTPEMVTHDEICYHINSLVSLNLHHPEGIKEFVFFSEHTTETIGEELEVDLEDFIDFENPSLEYREALSALKTTVDIIEGHRRQTAS